MKTHTVRIIESNSAIARCYTESSKTAAIRLARELVKGCVRGEGRVFVYEGDVAHEPGIALCNAPDPIKVLRA